MKLSFYCFVLSKLFILIRFDVENCLTGNGSNKSAKGEVLGDNIRSKDTWSDVWAA